MELHPFNQTSLSVTRIGLGLAALGRPGYINIGHATDLQHEYDPAAMEKHSHAVLDVAWENGIRYFDAARSYGRAEEFLSSWLISRKIKPNEVVVGSKWGYTYTADWQVDAEKHEVKEHSLPILLRQLQESRTLLSPYLKIYQIHSATRDSGVLENQAVLMGLAELRDKGVIIGLSLSGPKQADTLGLARSIQIGGMPLFGSVQATWNLLAREATEGLKEAHAMGMGIIIKEALANGRLTSRNHDSDFSPKRRLLEEIATEQGATIDALALAAVLAQPWVDIVLSGAAQAAHLNSNLMAMNIEWNDQIAERLAGLVESADEYWFKRSQMDWN